MFGFSESLLIEGKVEEEGEEDVPDGGKKIPPKREIEDEDNSEEAKKRREREAEERRRRHEEERKRFEEHKRWREENLKRLSERKLLEESGEGQGGIGEGIWLKRREAVKQVGMYCECSTTKNRHSSTATLATHSMPLDMMKLGLYQMKQILPGEDSESRKQRKYNCLIGEPV